MVQTLSSPAALLALIDELLFPVQLRSMPDVLLENLGKIYSPGVPAVDALNLHIHDGELLVLVGPSGCGKTTTLRLIAGLEEPTSGTIRIGNRDVTRLPPDQRDVALLFQRPALYPQRSVRDNLGAS